MNLTSLITCTLAEGSDPTQHVLSHPVSAKPILHLFGQDIYFNSHMLVMSIAAVLMLLIFPYMGSQAKRDRIPSGIRNFFEAILSFLRTDVFKPALGDNTDRFAPFLWTVFFFILFCNLLGMVPMNDIATLFGHFSGKDGEPAEFAGTPTGNISVTAALAVMAFITFHLSGITQQVRIQMDPSLDPHHTGHDHTQPHGHGGFIGSEGLENADVKVDHKVGDGHDHAHGLHHAHGSTAVAQGKAFPIAFVVGILVYIKNLVPPVPAILWLPMLGLELIGSLVKPFSLCIRLFANMAAGHLLLASFISLIFLANSVPARGTLGVLISGVCSVFSILELFVAFLQAYIFTFLTTLFISAAVAPEH